MKKLNQRAVEIAKQENVSIEGASRLACRERRVSPKRTSVLKKVAIPVAVAATVLAPITFTSCNESHDTSNPAVSISPSTTTTAYTSIYNGLTLIDGKVITSLRIDSVGSLWTGLSIRTDGTVELSGIAANSDLETYMNAVGFTEAPTFGAFTAPVGFAPALSVGDTWQNTVVDGSYSIISIEGSLATIDIRTNGTVETLRMRVSKKDLIVTLSTPFFALQKKAKAQ